MEEKNIEKEKGEKEKETEEKEINFLFQAPFSPFPLERSVNSPLLSRSRTCTGSLNSLAILSPQHHNTRSVKTGCCCLYSPFHSTGLLTV